jgi:hypothetical protein
VANPEFNEASYKYLHNLETAIVERKLALMTSQENFIQEEAFLAGQLALLQSLLKGSPYNTSGDSEYEHLG